MKTFSVVSSISMILTLTVALLSIVGIAITGLYPGIIVLWLLALVPIASRLYVTKRIRNSNDNHAKYYTTLTIINLLTILVVLWMTLVILHDRVLNDCC
jgi:predicted permease